jgi:hypothetical protein
VITETEGVDLDHPGYLRHCALPLCEAEFHVLRGPADGWRMGKGGPIGTSYFCPDHAALVMAHVPAWLRGEGPVTGTRCACGWEWTPAVQSPLGEHLLAWLLHLRPENHSAPPGAAREDGEL